MLAALRREIESTIIRHCDEPIHREAVLRALSRPGFALHPEGQCRAGALALCAYQTVRGTTNSVATLAAAAVELQLEASGMLDHVGDKELDPRHGIGAAEELALALTILTCGAASACEAVREAGPQLSCLNPLLEFHLAGISACGGQSLDTSTDGEEPITTEAALHITALKAGSLGRLAGEFGAGVATGDTELVRLFGQFGFNLFVYLQLLDDLRDACPAGEAKTDLAQHKRTVPLAFFYNSMTEAHRGRAGGMMPATAAENFHHEIRERYEDCGARVFGAIVAETFLNRAKSNLADLRHRVGKVESLERLVSPIEITTEDLLVVA